jgi:hypothetical protein
MGAEQLWCATGAEQLCCATGAEQLWCAMGAEQLCCATGAEQSGAKSEPATVHKGDFRKSQGTPTGPRRPCRYATLAS